MARSTTLGWLLLLAAAIPALAVEDSETFFEAKIRPVLVTECLKCHGGEKTSGGLSVVSRAALLQGGDRGPAIVAGDPERSLLIQAIRRTHDEVRMPPKKRLTRETTEDFARWIAGGAAWPSKAPIAATGTFDVARTLVLQGDPGC